MKKLKKNGGFTLVEMLIVVAIIAILVAVSIPLVNTSLEKAREATDAANERAAKAEATVKYLDAEFNAGATADKICYYDAANGKLVDAFPTDAGYGKCKNHTTKNVLAVQIKSDGEINLAWTNAAVTTWSADTTLHGGKVVDTTTP